MSTIWRAFVPAHRLQRSQITGEVYNTSRNVNDTFYSVIHPQRSQRALQVHCVKFAWAATGTDRQTHTHGSALLMAADGSLQLCCWEKSSPALRSPPSWGICFGRSTVTRERLQPESHITGQLALLPSVTREKVCSTLDFAMIEGKNPSSGLPQAAVCILNNRNVLGTSLMVLKNHNVLGTS